MALVASSSVTSIWSSTTFITRLPLVCLDGNAPRARPFPAMSMGEKRQRVCKPGSVHPFSGDGRSFLYAAGCPDAHAGNPDGGAGTSPGIEPVPSLFNLAPEIRKSAGWGRNVE